MTMTEHTHVLEDGDERTHQHVTYEGTQHDHGWGPTGTEAAFGPGDANFGQTDDTASGIAAGEDARDRRIAELEAQLAAQQAKDQRIAELEAQTSTGATAETQPPEPGT